MKQPQEYRSPLYYLWKTTC